MAGVRVLVVGDAMLDSYVRGATKGLCREAPVPAVEVGAVEHVPGAAGNVAANVAGLGGAAVLVTAVGADEPGCRLTAALSAAGVSTDAVTVAPGRDTVVRRRIVADGQLLTRLDEGSTGPLAGPTEDAVRTSLAAHAPAADAVIVCDYGYGTLTRAVAGTLAQIRPELRLVVLDAKDPARHRAIRPSAVKPNYPEAVAVLGLPALAPGRVRVGQVLDHGARLLELTGAELVTVTMDADGAVLFEPHRPPFHSYGGSRPGPALVGTGDAFSAALTLALAAGADPPVATELATVAALVAGTVAGTARCDRTELARRLSPAGAVARDQGSVTEWAASMRSRGRRVVLTNGCFDLLHEGHVLLLSQAKALGDVLVVGLNDDASVRRLKGAGRPVVDLAGRLRVLAALTCVDQVVAFGEDTADALIERIRPDVYVKGADYSPASLPEAATLDRLGVRVEFLATVPERSTSRIIERIRSHV